MSQGPQLTSHFIGIVGILCKLYGLKAIPPEAVLNLDRSRWTQARDLISGYAGRPVGNAVVDSFLDLRDMPLNEQIVLQHYLEDSGAYDPNLVPVSNSPTLSIPLTAGTASSKKSYLRIIGRLAPDLIQQDPRKALPVLYERLSIEDPKKYAPEKLTAMLTPVVDYLCENDDQIDSLNRTLSAILVQHDVDPKKSQSIAGSLLIYQLGHPDATADQLEKYFTAHLLPQIEADKPLSEEVTKSLAQQLSDSIIDHEQARLSNPAPDQETAKEYLQKLEQNTNKNLNFTSRELVVFSQKTGRPVFTDYGRAQADRFALTHLKNGQFDLNSALSEINSEKQKIRNAIQKMESGPITNYDDLIDLYQQQRYLNLSSSSLRLRQYHLSQKLRPDDQKITPLENELVAQFATHGLSSKEARMAAREYINSGSAVATRYLFDFVDNSNPKQATAAKTELFSDSLGFLKQKFPKLENFKLNLGKFDQAYRSIPYFVEVLNNPTQLISTFAQTQVTRLVNQLAQTHLGTNIKTELVTKALTKFANSEIGKKVVSQATIQASKLLLEKGVKIATRETIKKSLDAALTPILGPLAPIVGEVVGAVVAWAIEKVKDAVSWAKRKFKENAQYVIAGLAGLAGLVFSGGSVATGSLAGIGTYVGVGAVKSIGQIITGNPSPGLVRSANTVSQMLTAVVVETASESASALILTIFSIPIVLALFLFIINSGAYLTIPSSGTGGVGGAVPMCWPVEARITQDPCAVLCGDCTHSDGIDMNAFDLANVWNTPVYATHDGTVLSAIDAAYDTTGYGSHIIITSRDGSFYTLYAHLMTMDVDVGAVVLAGQQIGTMDSTGSGWAGAGTEQASHLHYELRTGTSTTSNNQCDLVDYVPAGWTYQGSTDYDGTCYARDAGGGSQP